MGSGKNVLFIERYDDELTYSHQLIAAFLVEILIWGFPGSYGVLLAVYLRDPVYTNQARASSLLPLVGTLCTGIMYFSCELTQIRSDGQISDSFLQLALVIYPTMQWYPRLRRVYTWIGTITCSASLVAASFTTDVRLQRVARSVRRFLKLELL